MNMLFRTLIIAFMIITLGCDNPFNPDSENNNNPTESNPNDSPENLISNLELAYNQKDIDLYKSCLADDFRFQLIETDVTDIGIDLDSDGIPDSEWGYQQEIEYHSNLFGDGSSDGQYPSPDTINLTFTSLIIDDDIEEGHEGWKIVDCHFSLQLFFTADNTALSANGYTKFYVRPIEDEWEIAIWRDQSNVYK